jgi:hypothetical protein
VKVNSITGEETFLSHDHGKALSRCGLIMYFSLEGGKDKEAFRPYYLKVLQKF